jgi:hypothetical protein
MANFKTHFLAASGLSGVAALACMKAGAVPAAETPILLVLGTLGGLLPDIDSDHSVPIKISFSLLAFVLAFLVMFRFSSQYQILELAAIWLIVFLAVRYMVLELFTVFTVHRGVFHSLLAVVFFGLSTVSLSYHLFRKPLYSAWLYGIFISLGYFIHLALDEAFSVDLLNRRIKSSFGTALKPISLAYWRATLLLMLATFAVYFSIPHDFGMPKKLLHRLEAYYLKR